MSYNEKQNNSLEIYLPNFDFKSLNSKYGLEQSLSNNNSIETNISLTEKSVYQLLCSSIGYEGADLPWNQLRALKLESEISKQILQANHTLACCDPVMMQVTHRGAYLWGQESINFSEEDMISIVAEINDKLMLEGESFHCLNNKQWLYVNSKEIELRQKSFESEIGRDQFGFSYGGKDGMFWERLATEIQMLIKQMIDYGKLNAVAAESLINVHFWGESNNKINSPIIIKQEQSFELFGNNVLINLFFEKVKLNCKNLTSFSQLIQSENSKTVAVVNSQDVGWLDNFVEDVATFEIKKNKSITMFFQDKKITIKSKRTLFERVVQRLFHD